MIWWPRYVGDWASATAELSLLEKGVYGELLDYCYSKETMLPLDPQAVYRIARCYTVAEQRACGRVLAAFFERTEHGYVNQRCATEIANWREKSGNNAKAAKTRWERERAKQALIENGKPKLAIKP